MYVAKWSPVSNTFVWAKQAGGAGSCEAQAIVIAGNNVYVAGLFTGATATFGGTVLANAGSSTTDDIFITKLTDAGSTANFVWAYKAGGSGRDHSFGLALNGSNLYLAASFSATATFGSTLLSSSGDFDVVVAKLVDAGNTAAFSWALRAGGAMADEPWSIVAVGNTLYLSGYFIGTAGFGTTTLNSLGLNDGFLTKLNDLGVTGNFEWTQQIGSSGADEAIGVAVNGNNVFVSGYFVGPTIRLGTTALTSAGYIDGFVAKLVDAGSTSSFSWAQRMGGSLADIAFAVAVRGNMVYTAGYFGLDAQPSMSSTATFDNTMLTALGGSDGFVTKLTDMGSTSNFNWTQQAGSSHDDRIYGLNLSGTRVYATGFFSGTIISLGSTPLVNTHSPDAASFLAALTDPTLLATTPSQSARNLMIWPNPAHDLVTIEVPPRQNIFATVELLDMLGRIVRPLTSLSAGASVSFSLIGLAPGLYAVRVKAAGNTYTQRLMVE